MDAQALLTIAEAEIAKAIPLHLPIDAATLDAAARAIAAQLIPRLIELIPNLAPRTIVDDQDGPIVHDAGDDAPTV